jgi:hypothetical protein
MRGAYPEDIGKQISGLEQKTVPEARRFNMLDSGIRVRWPDETLRRHFSLRALELK